jgi:hypothetical protein
MGLLPIFGVALERLSPKVDFHLMALIVSGGMILFLTLTLHPASEADPGEYSAFPSPPVCA